MAGRYRVAAITLLTVVGVTLAAIIAVLLTMPTPKSSADLPAATHPFGTPEYTTRPTSPVKTPAARQQGRIFGMSDPALLGETASQQKSDLAAMKATGIDSIRVDADWSEVQPNGPSSFDWGTLDQTVSSIMAAGMSADLIIDGCPQWAATSDSNTGSAPTPASPAQYATFAAQVAARFAPAGVNDFEIWNEPNITEFWQPAPNPQAYTAILKAAYPAIKKVAPSATVISGGLSPATSDGMNISPIDFVKAMYADGAKGNFDALGFHPYSFPATPDGYETWSGWSQMSETSPSVRSVMASYGDSGKKIWITEYGAPSSGPDGIGQAAQSASLTQAIYKARSSSWIGALYLYTWDDARNFASDEGDKFGLITAGGTKKAAYYGVASALRTAMPG
jgi:polysaccharide biosynthesis protein PslG